MVSTVALPTPTATNIGMKSEKSTTEMNIHKLAFGMNGCSGTIEAQHCTPAVSSRNVLFTSSVTCDTCSASLKLIYNKVKCPS